MFRKPKGVVQEAVDEEFLLRYNRTLILPILLLGGVGVFLQFVVHKFGGIGIALLALAGLGFLWLGVNEVQWRRARKNLPVRPLDESGKKE